VEAVVGHLGRNSEALEGPFDATVRYQVLKKIVKQNC
jgi:hypothetical protein